jgi:hypothetical protein
MDALAQLNSEFEALGEAAVAERLNANYYKGPARAVAMRWLNDKSLARAGIDAPQHGVAFDESPRRAVRAEQSARVAILFAVAAFLAAISSLGLSVQTLQAVQGLRQSVASAPVASVP